MFQVNYLINAIIYLIDSIILFLWSTNFFAPSLIRIVAFSTTFIHYFSFYSSFKYEWLEVDAPGDDISINEVFKTVITFTLFLYLIKLISKIFVFRKMNESLRSPFSLRNDQAFSKNSSVLFVSNFSVAIIMVAITLFHYLVLALGGRNVSISIPIVHSILVMLSVVPLIRSSWPDLLKLAYDFGKDKSFAFGLFFLWPIFLPILAFDNSVYTPTNPVQDEDDELADDQIE